MVQLQLPAYEGPLDLLLDLIESRKLDISELSLAEVADQYLAQVAAMSAPAPTGEDAGAHVISPEQADALAAFISIGGRLVLLKARQLLPPASDDPDDEESQNDAQELVEMAIAYKRYRDGINQLSQRDQEQLRSYTPIAAPPINRPLPLGMSEDLTLDTLARIAQEVLDRAAEQASHHESAHDAAIERQRVTVRDRVTDLRARLISGHALSFRAWISTAESKLELIVSFMAVLELHKSLAIEFEQQHDFADIWITALPDAPDTAWSAADSTSFDQ